MFPAKPTSRFIPFALAFLLLTFTVLVTANEDPVVGADTGEDDDGLKELTAIDEQEGQEHDQHQQGFDQQKEAEITVKSLTVSNLHIGKGTDFSGVPTKMLTVNGSLRMSIYNPATVGIHVSSTPIKLIYSEIAIATGQLKKYYQPRKSHRTVSVTVEGNKVPLYGAGSNLVFSQTGVVVPSTLKFEIQSQGNVVGKLVKTKYRKHISCPVVLDSSNSKPIKFKKNTC
ncbi:hypothetical protein Tsubulata_035069, partial [Turnera subulata]